MRKTHRNFSFSDRAGGEEVQREKEEKEIESERKWDTGSEGEIDRWSP